MNSAPNSSGSVEKWERFATKRRREDQAARRVLLRQRTPGNHSTTRCLRRLSHCFAQRIGRSLWAFTKHDSAAFAQTVEWDPEIKARATEVFNSAPEAARQRFGSIDGVLYAMMATPGFTELNVTGFGVASQNVSGDEATLSVQEQHGDGSVRQTPIPMQRFEDGWHVITPSKMVDVLGRYLGNPQLWAMDSTGNK